MSDSPYQVLGVGIPPMLGRERLFTELCRHLTKPTPDHMCVVGPPLFGKSVLLNHLASHFKDAGDHYSTSLYWDLRHSTPMTDEEFRRRFAKRIKDALQSVQPDLAESLDPEDKNLHDFLLVFDDMKREGLRFLAVLDGFDHVLAGSDITRNFWDEMLTLCRMTSLRLVTGSRRRLRELCRTEESRTSDFWEIFFDTPLLVGCFEKDDWSDFLKPFNSKGIQLDSSAREEIESWTGGVPILATTLAERLLSEAPENKSLSKSHVNTIAKETAEEKRDLLAALWDDCSSELRSNLAALSKDDISLSEIPVQQRRDLQLRGFARLSENKLQSSCLLMDQYAKEQAGEVENLQRLFGDAERFESNIRRLLELRLDQVCGADPELMGYVKHAIQNLHPYPAISVGWARPIAQRALKLIWKAELPANKSLPEEWKFAGVPSDTQGRLLQGPGPQCNTLRIITGTEKHPTPVSQFVTKPTCLLVDHLHSVGNFGHHMGEESTVSVPIAASFCLSAISLCESLARDLATSEEEV